MLGNVVRSPQLFGALLVALAVGCGGKDAPCTPTSCGEGQVCGPSGACVSLDGSVRDGSALDGSVPDGAADASPSDGASPVALATSLVSAEMTTPTSIELVFDGRVEGSNLGFALFGTRSNEFTALSGFGTNTLTATIAEDVVYGEIV